VLLGVVLCLNMGIAALRRWRIRQDGAASTGVREVLA
jgi:hypothetical protein